jgi:hypothetical protein
MGELMINDAVAERLYQIAQQENRSIENLLEALLDLYARQTDTLTAMDGMFDDDVSDLSTSVRETMNDYYQKRYGDSN